MKRALTWLGWAIQAIAALCILGWLQGGDPDCAYSTGTGAQLRMCDPAIVGEAAARSWWALLLYGAILAGGVLLVRWGRREHRD